MKEEQIEKLRQALKKDFNYLYRSGYATDWEAKRLVRSTEIEIMQLDHLLKFIESVKGE